MRRSIIGSFHPFRVFGVFRGHLSELFRRRILSYVPWVKIRCPFRRLLRF